MKTSMLLKDIFVIALACGLFFLIGYSYGIVKIIQLKKKYTKFLNLIYSDDSYIYEFSPNKSYFQYDVMQNIEGSIKIRDLEKIIEKREKTIIKLRNLHNILLLKYCCFTQHQVIPVINNIIEEVNNLLPRPLADDDMICEEKYISINKNTIKFDILVKLEKINYNLSQNIEQIKMHCNLPANRLIFKEKLCSKSQLSLDEDLPFMGIDVDVD